MDLKCTEIIRVSELESVLNEIKFSKPGRNVILEIGAGTGWQSKKLAEDGNEVEAIDIKNSTHSGNRVWQIIDYDGVYIPFSDNHFDIVFSSNVLEHIAHLNRFQLEIKRVLKPNGIAIHIVPSETWRFWTSMTHYINVFKIILKSMNKNTAKTPSMVSKSVQNERQWRKNTDIMKKAMFPYKHGVNGNWFTEIFYFTKYYWKKRFIKSGWKIVKYWPNRLFYTGYMIFGSTLSISVRRKLSYLFGSACHVFILQNNDVRHVK